MEESSARVLAKAKRGRQELVALGVLGTAGPSEGRPLKRAAAAAAMAQMRKGARPLASKPKPATAAQSSALPQATPPLPPASRAPNEAHERDGGKCPPAEGRKPPQHRDAGRRRPGRGTQPALDGPAPPVVPKRSACSAAVLRTEADQAGGAASSLSDASEPLPVLPVIISKGRHKAGQKPKASSPAGGSKAKTDHEDVAAPLQPAQAMQQGLPIGAGADPEPAAAAALFAALVSRAAAQRDLAGWPRGHMLTLRHIMKAGVLAGQPVQFRARHGAILLRGMVLECGAIACGCEECGGAPASCSVFEEHAGSRERRPGDFIFVDALGLSLKDFCAAVNSAEAGLDRHDMVCGVCGDGGDLLCCDACPGAAHAACSGLDAVPKGNWFCAACTAAGRSCVQFAPLPKGPAAGPVRRAVAAKPASPAAPRKSSTKPGHGKPAKEEPGTATPSSKKPPAKAAPAKQAASPSGNPLPGGRVHMAVPVCRGVSGARRERNSNKHKRLFQRGEPDGLQDGEPVEYVTSQGERLLSGVVRLGDAAGAGAGIECAHCGEVVSCSQFEAHAGRGSRRAPYDNIFTQTGISLRKMAQALPGYDGKAHGPLPLETEPDGVREDAGGGCVLCTARDFLRGGFGPRTVIICDQCEREFHVGCLADTGRAHLSELPAGALRARVDVGAVPAGPDHAWQLLHGKDGRVSTTWALRGANEIMTASFDPILELATGADLVQLMVYAQQAGDWDYTGMHTAILKHRGKAVCCAVLRVFGPQLAEMPLVATHAAARRRGHARILLRACEAFLAQVGVQTLCLPAAAETIGMWMHGFGFVAMPEEQLDAARAELRLLIFPGTTLLCKPLGGGKMSAGLPLASPLSPQLTVTGALAKTALVATAGRQSQPLGLAGPGCDARAGEAGEAAAGAPADMQAAAGSEGHAPATPERSPPREDPAGFPQRRPHGEAAGGAEASNVQLPWREEACAGQQAADSGPPAAPPAIHHEVDGAVADPAAPVAGSSRQERPEEAQPRGAWRLGRERSGTPPALAAVLRRVEAMSASEVAQRADSEVVEKKATSRSHQRGQRSIARTKYASSAACGVASRLRQRLR